MAAKEKPDQLIKVGTPSGSGSKQHNQYIHSIHFSQAIKAVIVRLACWELLPAALAVFLLGGLRHE
jgi:hypothetical protein